MMNRRSFLQAGLGAAAVASLPSSLFAAYKKGEKRIPIALQLYSLRTVAGQDVPAALKKVAEMGYEGVEFAGYYGFDGKPQELRKMLDDVGLKATSTHIGFGAIQGDALKKSAEIAHALGFNKLIVPGGLEGRMRASHDSNKKIAEEMSKCAEEAAKLDCLVGFHGHTGDFLYINGTEDSAWTTFFNNCDERVIAQVDVGWANNAMRKHGIKLTPAETIAALPGRGKCIHIKSNGDVHGCAVADSDDKVDWASVLDACREKGGTEWFVVEQEQFKVNPWESAKDCIDNLKKIGW
ncbi:MAG: TIM barrel protein [Thermoguttaceae bacterium]|nr:TIM barrel protein [Thermoguttaceae bacterium]MBQ9800149.1 TIM barrel protein [Thermoguttaceae bacterium]MBR2005818.1 TIM barrel protein [Thermoguttaceae bacterium]